MDKALGFYPSDGSSILSRDTGKEICKINLRGK